MKYLGILLLSLTCFASPVSTGCAWVLWTERTNIGVGDVKYEKAWIVEVAYPEDGYVRCVQDAKTLAQRKLAGAKTAPYVKLAELSTLVGERQYMKEELKSGGIFITTWACFPDNVKPD